MSQYMSQEFSDARAQLQQCNKDLILTLDETLRKALNPNVFVDSANVRLWKGNDEIQMGLRIYLTDEDAIDLGYYIDMLMHRRIEDPKKSSFSSISISNDHRGSRLFIRENESECNIINITKLLNIYSKFINNRDDILKQLLEIDLKYYEDYFAAFKVLDELEIRKFQNDNNIERGE